MKKAKRFLIITTGLIDENGKPFSMLFPKKFNQKKYFDKQYKKNLLDLTVKCLNVQVVYECRFF